MGIQSAFVVQLVGLYEGPLNSVLVTEYLAGGDLITRTAPDDYCLTERKCQIFIRQIVRGIQFIHSQRILHLDIKPFNVVFVHTENDHDLRIIDFGIAQELKENEDKIPIAMSGTLEYMSPEVMDCKHASPASDMWSLGATAFQLLSGGVAPFLGRQQVSDDGEDDKVPVRLCIPQLSARLSHGHRLHSQASGFGTGETIDCLSCSQPSLAHWCRSGTE